MAKTPEQELADREAERQAEGARVRAEAIEKKADETVPGGRFIVDGRTVNSEGEEIGKGKTATGEAEDLNDLTVAELKDRAREAEVSGFSTMTKDELVKAVRRAEKA